MPNNHDRYGLLEVDRQIAIVDPDFAARLRNGQRRLAGTARCANSVWMSALVMLLAVALLVLGLSAGACALAALAAGLVAAASSPDRPGKSMMERGEQAQRTARPFRPGETSGSPVAPGHVAVVGAGMVGLAVAWFLQERGARVTAIERGHVAAGASWGNAGWLTPALTAPLPQPSVLGYGLRAVISPDSPVYLPIRGDLHLWRFLLGFARHCTARQWRRAMDLGRVLNDRALEAFDALSAGGLTAPTRRAEPFLACFRDESERAGLSTSCSPCKARARRSTSSCWTALRHGRSSPR